MHEHKYNDNVIWLKEEEGERERGRNETNCKQLTMHKTFQYLWCLDFAQLFVNQRLKMFQSISFFSFCLSLIWLNWCFKFPGSIIILMKKSKQNFHWTIKAIWRKNKNRWKNIKHYTSAIERNNINIK